jgi:hypothetical protein
MLIRVSATHLESYRRYVEEDWMKEADLLAGIRGEFQGSPRVDIGLAFGQVLAEPSRYYDLACDWYVCQVRGVDYVMTPETMREPLALMDHEHGVFEVKGDRRYGATNVVAKADMLIGSHIVENKTTLDSGLDVDEYQASLQWRFMADIFHATRITYHVFHVDDHGQTTDASGRARQEISCRGVDSFRLYPYPSLHADCAEWADRFTQYVIRKGLAPVLQERQVRAQEVSSWSTK